MNKATCAWDGCDRDVTKRGHCDRCYKRARKAGLASGPRVGICGDCGAEFQAGRAGAVAGKCPTCRNPEARETCLACDALIPRIDRGPRSGLGPASLYCSDECKPRCVVVSCERPRRKMDWCANHYTTWRMYGDPEREPKYTWAVEHRCVVCGLTDASPEWERRFRKFCSRRCAQLFRKHEGNVPTSVPCGKCGVDVPLVVSVGDRRRRRSDTAYCAACIRHARIYITAAELAAEDGAWCRLCSGDVDMTLVSPDRLSATVDHIIPRALGGSDDRANLQLAHRGCNSSKRHRFVG